MPRDMLSPNTDDSLAVRVLEILRRRKILAVTTFMTVLAAALAFARYLPDLYRGTAMVLIERPISESILKAPVSGELESRLGRSGYRVRASGPWPAYRFGGMS